MSWTWTGYDLDAVHRFKDESFFQTGRNSAEARFWKLKIHEEADRRGTKSSIVFDRDESNDQESSVTKETTENQEKSEEDENEKKVDDSGYNCLDYKYSYAQPSNETPTDYSTEYLYTYPDPRDRSMSIVSTMGSRGKQFRARNDYQYSYAEEEENEESEENEEKKNKQKEDEANKNLVKESAPTKKDIKSLKSSQAVLMPHSNDFFSSRFY